MVASPGAQPILRLLFSAMWKKTLTTPTARVRNSPRSIIVSTAYGRVIEESRATSPTFPMLHLQPLRLLLPLFIPKLSSRQTSPTSQLDVLPFHDGNPLVEGRM